MCELHSTSCNKLLDVVVKGRQGGLGQLINCRRSRDGPEHTQIVPNSVGETFRQINSALMSAGAKDLREMLDVAQPTPIDEVVKLTMEPERLGLGDRKETFDCSKVVPTIFKCFL